MAGLSKTYSGDFTSFVAGKLLNAAGMAKSESDRRETKNLEKARPGSLFAKALQSEFGGDLYNRTLGNFDPRKSAAETDRKSSKEARYRAQFGDLKKTPKSDLDDAEKELLKDDDSIPVKDVDARTGLTKLLGAGLDAKLILANARVTGLSNDVKSVKDNLVNTQKLIYDQNELLGSKFDQILGIFSAQQDYQKKVADEAKVKRREDELELEQDRSRTRKLESAFGGKKGKDIFGRLLGTAADILRGRGSNLTRKLLDALLSSGGKPGSIFSGIRKALGGKKAIYETLRTDTLEEALGIKSRPLRKAFQKTKAKDAEFIADLLEVPVEKLPQVLKGGRFESELDELVEMGMDPKEARRLKKSAQNIVKSRPAGKAGALKRMGDKVFKRVSSAAGAQKLAKAGTAGLSKGLGKAGKFVPGIGTVVALGEAAYRFSKKDTLGGIMSLGSAIPILGWGFTAFDIARDLGFDPLNTLPNEYERGTNLTKPGDAILHGTEAILGRQDRKDMMDSYQESVNQVGSTLVSSAVSLADSVGQGQAVKSELKKSGLSFDIVRMPISSKIGKTGQLSVLSSLEKDFKREIFSKKSDDPEKEQKEEEDDDGKNDPVDPNTEVPEPVSSNSPGRNGSYASGTWIGPAGDNDGNQTGLNMNLPGGIGTPIYAPVDLIYRSRGTDGNPSVGLQGTADALGPSGSGFGYYGAYYFEKDGREYEVLMGHFRDMPYKGSQEGEKIPKGTLIGYQGASGRSVSSSGGVYPHISLHVNAVDVSQGRAGNDILKWFADGLAGGNISTGNGGGGGGHRSIALHELSKDEALSSLTPGVNDYIKPGGRSVVSNMRWQDLNDDTLIYPYIDSVGQPTIGYGSAGMRGVTMNTRPITVRQAKAILLQDIDRIEKGLSKNIKHWKSMSDQQKAALIMFEYNAGIGNAYGGYRQLSAALEEGNMRKAADQLLRGGPAPSRIETEQRLLLSGPQQIVGPGIVGPGKVGEGKVGAGLPFIPDLTIKKFVDAIKKGINDGMNDSRETFDRGLIPTRNNRVNQLQSNSSLMEDMEEDSMVQQVYIINNVVASSTTPFVISSSGGSNTDYVDQYRMASLGA